MKYIDGFRTAEGAAYLRDRIRDAGARLAEKGKSVRFMEVCGSHSMAIARCGIRSMLPDNVELVSGPGCPVCVTDPGYIDTALEIARQGHIIVTFGDLVRVPGTQASLSEVRSEGARVEVVYSPKHAADLARAHSRREVVFLAVGFETTAPAVVSLVRTAIEHGLDNLSLLVAFKRVVPVLEVLAADPEIQIDGFLCPPHVTTIIGSNAYTGIVGDHGIGCVVAGFEPLDILYGIHGLLEQEIEGQTRLVNQYNRVVRREGNRIAQELMRVYLEPETAEWRGMGRIESSGFRLRPDYGRFDAAQRFSLPVRKGNINRECRCGDVLKGKIHPNACPLFSRVCTPLSPKGACMVSSEGSCAAWYRYERAAA